MSFDSLCFCVLVYLYDFVCGYVLILIDCFADASSLTARDAAKACQTRSRRRSESGSLFSIDSCLIKGQIHTSS